MAGLLAGLWGRVRGAGPGSDLGVPSVSGEPAASRASGVEWRSAAPVQRTLGPMSPVVTLDFAGGLTTYGNPALTGGIVASGRGIRVLDDAGRGADTGGAPDPARNTVTRAATAGPATVRRPPAPVRAGGSGTVQRAGEEGPVGGSAPAMPGAPDGPGASNGSLVPLNASGHTSAKPARRPEPSGPSGSSGGPGGESGSRGPSARQVARATLSRSARPPLLSAPSVTPLRRLATAGGGRAARGQGSAASAPAADGTASSVAQRMPPAAPPEAAKAQDASGTSVTGRTATAGGERSATVQRSVGAGSTGAGVQSATPVIPVS